METPNAVPQLEKVVEGGIEGMCSPVENQDGSLYVLSNEGEIYNVVEGQTEFWFSTQGQPNDLLFDPNNQVYICDMSHKAILTHTEIEGKTEITPIVKDYEGKPLLGPNSIALNETSNYLYFTDSGPLNEANLSNPNGSIFAADLDVMVLKPLVLNCLAFPAGIALTSDGSAIFVAETLKNRILRLAQQSGGVYQMSVFYQFSGKLGPTCLTMSENNKLYVARYDYNGRSENGIISVLSMEGEISYEFGVPGSPEITGLRFSRNPSNLLFITEATRNTCYRMIVPSEQT